jgi:hypothetical protein
MMQAFVQQPWDTPVRKRENVGGRLCCSMLFAQCGDVTYDVTLNCERVAGNEILPDWVPALRTMGRASAVARGEQCPLQQR